VRLRVVGCQKTLQPPQALEIWRVCSGSSKKGGMGHQPVDLQVR